MEYLVFLRYNGTPSFYRVLLRHFPFVIKGHLRFWRFYHVLPIFRSNTYSIAIHYIHYNIFLEVLPILLYPHYIKNGGFWRQLGIQTPPFAKSCAATSLCLPGEISAQSMEFLVGGWATPLKNMSSSIGMMIPNIWKNKKKIQTTNQSIIWVQQ